MRRAALFVVGLVVSLLLAATPGLAQAPSAPTLTAVARPGRIDLSWAPPSTNGTDPVLGYKLYRGTASGLETFVTTLGIVIWYIDTSVTVGTTYYYQVSAFSSAGEGPRSNEVSATPLEATPPSIAITYPASNARLTVTTVTVRGTASDNVAVAKVELSTDGRTWILANGTTSWYGNVTFIAGGANGIYARATDTAGNTNVVGIVVTLPDSTPNQSPQGLDPTLVASIAVAFVVVAAVAALIVWVRGKKRTQRPPAAPPP